MDRDELESMTVAQLKILLEENSLSKSGKKSDLVERLLENSFLHQEEDFLILEEEDHFDDEIKIPETSSSIPSNGKIEVMEATILEAVLVEDDKSPETPSLK
ncbi:MAG: SAP domain-containing protein, partial [Candidatus Thermoplasmatota archaeon]|nr:SAP domain-containing protein [Candidatus Thermoplasmatota archaeon]